MKDEEGRSLIVGYHRQGDLIRNRFLPDTAKPPQSVYFSHFSYNPEPSLDLIEFSA